MEEKKLPKFMKENDDGTYTITAKGKEYVLKELTGREIEKARKVAESQKIDESAAFAMRGLVSPEMNESDFVDLPGAVYFKLTGATKWIYELDDFLE